MFLKIFAYVGQEADLQMLMQPSLELHLYSHRLVTSAASKKSKQRPIKKKMEHWISWAYSFNS